jgi:hypothetical protein
MADDIGTRIRRFRAELERDRDRYLQLGRWNYRAAYTLSIVTVISSAAAGILGLGFAVDKRIVALIALIPAIAVTVANQFKWQDKANWHYRKHDAAKALLRRINYELPAHPTEAQLAELSRGYSVTEAEMSESWEEMRFAVEEAAEAEAAAGEGEGGPA